MEIKIPIEIKKIPFSTKGILSNTGNELILYLDEPCIYEPQELLKIIKEFNNDKVNIKIGLKEEDIFFYDYGMFKYAFLPKNVNIIPNNEDYLGIATTYKSNYKKINKYFREGSIFDSLVIKLNPNTNLENFKKDIININTNLEFISIQGKALLEKIPKPKIISNSLLKFWNNINTANINYLEGSFFDIEINGINFIYDFEFDRFYNCQSRIYMSPDYIKEYI